MIKIEAKIGNKLRAVMGILKRLSNFSFPLFSGLILGISFLHPALNFLGLIALLPLFIFLNSKNFSPKGNFLSGFAAGFIFFGIIFLWYFETLPLDWVGIENKILGFTLVFLVWLLSIIWLALFIGFFTLFYQNFKQSRLFIVLVPAFWIIFEYLRAWAFGILSFGKESFLGPHWTFGNLGYLLSSNPNLIKIAGWGGIYLLSFLVVFGNTLIYLLLKKIQQEPKHRKIAVLGLVSLASSIAASYFFESSRLTEKAPSDALQIAIVQTDRPSFFQQTRRQAENLHKKQLDLLKEISQSNRVPQIIIFPEDSRFLSFSPQETENFLQKYFDSKHHFLLIDSSRTETKEGLKSLITFFDNQKGAIAFQEKILLAPAGEYLPYAIEIPARIFVPDWLAKFEKSRGYQRGKDITLGELSGIKIGGLFCSEILSPAIYRQISDEGADILFNIASLAPFHGSTILGNQIEAMAKLRAIESGRYLIRATNYGLSYITDDNGKILTKTKRPGNQILYGEVYPLREKTFYTQYGDWILIFALALLFFIFGKSFIGRCRIKKT